VVDYQDDLQGENLADDFQGGCRACYQDDLRYPDGYQGDCPAGRQYRDGCPVDHQCRDDFPVG